MNVTQPTQDALMAIIGKCYEMNRYLDRFVTVLGVDFVCNEASDLIHHGMSHWYPIFADKIGERCLERYNISVKYQPTSSAEYSWDTVTVMMKELMERTIDFQNMLNMTRKIAFDNEDYSVECDLVILITYHNYLVEQAILLNDKIEQYKESNSASFDAHIRSHFWILGKGLEGEDD